MKNPMSILVLAVMTLAGIAAAGYSLIQLYFAANSGDIIRIVIFSVIFVYAAKFAATGVSRIVKELKG